MATTRKRLTPSQRLRKKLYPIKFTEDIETTKKKVNWAKLIRLAREVRKTFKEKEDEYPAQFKPSL